MYVKAKKSRSGSYKANFILYHEVAYFRFWGMHDHPETTVLVSGMSGGKKERGTLCKRRTLGLSS